MTSRFLASSAAATAIIAVAGCASSGAKIDPAALSKIVVGKTTKSEMLQMFGSPMTQAFSSDGKLTMMWFYVHVGPFGSGMIQQNLSVLFDQQERVERFNLIDSANAGPRLGS